jgi:hypothetical protein
MDSRRGWNYNSLNGRLALAYLETRSGYIEPGQTAKDMPWQMAYAVFIEDAFVSGFGIEFPSSRESDTLNIEIRFYRNGEERSLSLTCQRGDQIWIDRVGEMRRLTSSLDEVAYHGFLTSDFSQLDQTKEAFGDCDSFEEVKRLIQKYGR